MPSRAANAARLLVVREGLLTQHTLRGLVRGEGLATRAPPRARIELAGGARNRAAGGRKREPPGEAV
eukprot:4121604-Alexandrium_andersonii.AAC.1